MAPADSGGAQALTDGNARPQQASPLLGSRCYAWLRWSAVAVAPSRPVRSRICASSAR